jgi:ankyrin repeat protein
MCKAAYNGQVGVMRALVAKSAKVNCVTKSNQSPLYLAALAGQLDAVTFLLEAGADVHVRVVMIAMCWVACSPS